MQTKVSYNKKTKIVTGFYLLEQNAPQPYIIINQSNIPSFSETLIVNIENNTIEILPKSPEELLNELKTQKLQELDIFFRSNNLWLFTLKDNKGNALTKTQEWFLMRVTTNIQLIDNQGKLVIKTISNPDNIKTLLNNKGLEIQICKIQLEKYIQAIQNFEELNKLDVQQSFSQINKVIIID